MRKLALDIGAELRYVTSMMRPFSGSSVLITKNNGRHVMYVVNYVSGKRIRTTVKSGSIAHRDITVNIILEAKSHILKENYDAIVTAGRSFTDYCDREVVARVKSKYPGMDTDLIYNVLDDLNNNVKDLSDWAKQPYKQFSYKEEGKIHTTSRGLKVRSKSELALCELFYELGIEFRYEEEMILGGKAFGPDFTIRRKSDGKIFYWEHCGMMDDPDYRKRNAEKLAAYEENGIVPWDNLIITYDSDGSIDLSLAEAIAGAVLCI
ncbi:MAG: hypothetical protein IKI86_01035 [Firmicutes bacterium]|nr:hypothetical protein [Bacillota bacterium]